MRPKKWMTCQARIGQPCMIDFINYEGQGAFIGASSNPIRASNIKI